MTPHPQYVTCPYVTQTEHIPSGKRDTSELGVTPTKRKRPLAHHTPFKTTPLKRMSLCSPDRTKSHKHPTNQTHCRTMIGQYTETTHKRET
ncbi:hypothetical protein HYC85_012010 [Camellia sinensis]|uniref:Uncharacterized protein n=1 Tax=Camellia sinensis TaxID=4442 RepID=A0A7J7HBW3_CAMSI|nr:hypothetical protein HYC85_012010 [Camellia sinensis]